jgi:phosphoglycerate dehydrogenase-like enzyme
MTEPLTLILAGRMSKPRVAEIREQLADEWNIISWTEEEPFERFVELVPKADALVGGQIEGDWPPVPRLKLYQVPFAGIDWLSPSDVPAGCAVCNTYEHEIAIAEYVYGGLLEWEIGFRTADARMRTHGWDGRSAGIGPTHGEMHGRTIGMLGYGRIGREVAARAHAFGLRAIAVSRSPRETPPELDWYGTFDALDRLLEDSDYVIAALPLAEETIGLIDAGRFARMKSDGVIVNVGRGRVIDEEALFTALSIGQIGGAVIDVWYTYPTPEDPCCAPSRFPFEDLDNVIMTPHFSARTAPMRARRLRSVCANLNRLARGEPLQNVCFVGTG